MSCSGAHAVLVGFLKVLTAKTGRNQIDDDEQRVE